MNHPSPELAHQLKQLRLSGFMDSLETRNRQAIESKLPYTDFLAQLVGDEVARRDQNRFAIRMRRAQFKATKTLEQFDFTRLPALNRMLIHDLAAGRFITECTPVLIVGPSGTGKSHLAQALGQCAIRQGIDVLFATCSNLTSSLPLRSPADEDLHDLIAARYETSTTIVTSNLDFSEWDQAFTANRLLAAATLDRLRHNAYCLTLDGASYREPKLAPAQKQKTLAKPITK
jgi:DNA replication protein DnaC